MIKSCLILIILFLFLPCTANAANVYLRDGGVIQCLLAKQQAGMVYVLVNRDTEVELDSRIVALQKTFNNRKMIGSYRRYNNARFQR